MGSTPDQSPGQGWNPGFSIDRVIFWGLILVQTSFIWLFEWFPTQDGPSHVDNASALIRLLSGDVSILSQY